MFEGLKVFSRIINDKKTKDFPTPLYGYTGFLGYEESDEHYRERIIDCMNNKDSDMKDKSIVINNLWFYRIFNGMFTGGNNRFLKYVIPEDILVSMLDENIQYQDEIEILDIGCGDGKCLDYVSKMFFHNWRDSYFMGIDMSKKLIDKALKKYGNEYMTFIQGNIKEIPRDNESVDMVLCSFTFHHLPMNIKNAGMKEIYRVLKPGGHLMYIDHGKPHNAWTWIITNLFTMHFEYIGSQVNGEILELMRKEDFEIERHIKKTVFNGNVDCILARKNEIQKV